MLSQLYSMSYPYKDVVIDPHYTRLVPSQSVENGVLVRQSVFQQSCVEDSNKEFSIEDWSLGNIISTGATHLLKPCSMTNTDVAGVAASIDSVSKKLTGDENS